MAYQAQTLVVFDATAEVAAHLAAEAAAFRRLIAGAILTAAVDAAPEVTGGLKASGYLVDEAIDTYQEAVAAAASKNPGIELLPKVEIEPDTTIVAFAASYAATNELYTGPANPGAHPFLGPASEAQRPAFEAGVAQLGEKLT
jgi:hypothetical protein